MGWGPRRSAESRACKLEDPDDAIFRNEKPGGNGATCGEVNGKNGAGEFTGFRRYLHVPTMTLLSPDEPDFVAVLSGRRPAVDTATACTFAITWTALCTDPSQRTAETVAEHRCDLYGDPDRENRLKADLGIR